MQLRSAIGLTVSAKSGTCTLLFQCALRRTSARGPRAGLGGPPISANLTARPSAITPSAAGNCHARGRREKRLCCELAADSPAGTTENSPALQRWVGRFAGKKSRQGRQRQGLGETSFVPAGTRLVSAPNPALKCWAIFCRPPGWGGDFVQPGRTGETPGQRAAGFAKLALMGGTPKPARGPRALRFQISDSPNASHSEPLTRLLCVHRVSVVQIPALNPVPRDAAPRLSA